MEAERMCAFLAPGVRADLSEDMILDLKPEWSEGGS